MDDQYLNTNKMDGTSSSEEDEQNSNQARTQRRWPAVIKRRRRTRHSRASTNIDINQLRATNSSYLSTPYSSNERVMRHKTAMTNMLRVLSDSIIDEQSWNLHLLASVVSGVKYMEVNYEPGMRERRSIRRTDRQMVDTEQTEAEAREEGEPSNEAHSVPGHRQFHSDDANPPYPPRFKNS